ncbi:hypothetical protein BJX68DRAFT_236058 [Aspergillus pseudodeflectus]|uniref:Uncharacterized protein n=1 Tax=Aspergillus pseudodeflectus TaxID=176178 RepID=A0ABR4KG63_9EURO
MLLYSNRPCRIRPIESCSLTVMRLYNSGKCGICSLCVARDESLLPYFGGFILLISCI